MIDKKELERLHGIIVTGLVNGLSHTYTDGRTDQIDFWRKRSGLFEAFSRCIIDLMTNQSLKYAENELKEIAKEGFKI